MLLFFCMICALFQVTLRTTVFGQFSSYLWICIVYWWNVQGTIFYQSLNWESLDPTKVKWIALVYVVIAFYIVFPHAFLLSLAMSKIGWDLWLLHFLEFFDMLYFNTPFISS